MTEDITADQAAAEPFALVMRAGGLSTDRGTRGSNKAGPVPVNSCQ